MIGFGDTVRRALDALWRRSGMVCALALAWLALDGFLLGYLRVFHSTSGIAYLLWFDDLVSETWMASDGMLFVVSLAAEFIRDGYGAVFVVLFLRLLLNGSPIRGGRPDVGLLSPLLLVLLFRLAMTALLHPAEQVMSQMAAPEGNGIVLWSMAVAFLWFLVQGWVLSKLCLVLPSAALGNGWQLRQSWRGTRGLTARLFVLYMLAALPGYVLLLTVSTALVFRPPPLAEIGQIQVLAMHVAASAASITLSMLWLAAVAVAFTTVTAFPAVGVPGAGRTPKQLAEAFE